MAKRLLLYFNRNKSISKHFTQSNKMVYSLTPPDTVQGMTVLNRDAFTMTVEVPCLILPTLPINNIISVVKKYLLKLRHWKPVQKIDDTLVIYLDPMKIEKFDDINDNDRAIISVYTDKIDKKSLTLHYENWQHDDILRAVLPPNLELPTSYTKVGHILHLNLRNNQLPYKNLIGQVYLDFIPQTKTVVNKLNNIKTEFRHFPMEILAGENDTVTMVKENNCKFTFDFAKVYWNSRLSTEHSCLLTYMNKGDVLYDVFAGVGPFAVPAARKGLTVLANDLNPESFKWLQHNAQANKVKNFHCFNKDGRDFLKNDVKCHLLNRRRTSSPGIAHIAMNLPAIAHEFLDIFHDWMDTDEINEISNKSILVHLYCFVKAEKTDDFKSLAQSLVEDSLGCKLSAESINTIHHVRNVAPNKEMFRVSFYLNRIISEIVVEPVRKKFKSTDNSIDATITDNNGEKYEEKNEKCSAIGVKETVVESCQDERQKSCQ